MEKLDNQIETLLIRVGALQNKYMQFKENNTLPPPFNNSEYFVNQCDEISFIARKLLTDYRNFFTTSILKNSADPIAAKFMQYLDNIKNLLRLIEDDFCTNKANENNIDKNLASEIQSYRPK